MSIWRDPKVVKRFQELFSDNLPFSNIAAVLYVEFKVCLTRNAVIGRAHRMGLIRSSSPRVTKLRKPAVLKFRRQDFPQPANDPAPLPPVVPMIASAEYLCTIFDLTDKSCRYPTWGDDELPVGEKLYCGIPTANISDSRPYCSCHAAMTVGDTPKRSSKPYPFNSNGKRAA